MDNTLERLTGLVKSRFGRAPQPGESFDSLEMDSLAMAEFSLDIEKEFKIRLNDRVTEVQSLEEMADYVRQLLDNAKKSP